MGGSKTLALLLAVLAASAAGMSPARGQCRLCDSPTTAAPQSSGADRLTLEVETSLNFDQLILSGEGDGAAVIRPDGSNIAQGALARISPRAMVGTAVIRGTPGRIVRVELPRRIELHSRSGGRMTVNDLVTDLPSLPRLDSGGSLTFRLGGRVAITGDSEGDYRGDVPITVEYQ